MTSPETLAAMLTDAELRQRAAELAEDIRVCDRALNARLTWYEGRDNDRMLFRALWRALRVIRAEQERRD
jgi:hypothetical protein